MKQNISLDWKETINSEEVTLCQVSVNSHQRNHQLMRAKLRGQNISDSQKLQKILRAYRKTLHNPANMHITLMSYTKRGRSCPAGYESQLPGITKRMADFCFKLFLQR
jgi:hypothetical protein